MHGLAGKIKKLVHPLMSLPVHPQWHAATKGSLKTLLSKIPPTSTVLDIGCFNRWPKQFLDPGVEYIGADYPATAEEWYQTRPQVYLDGHQLPFADHCIDRVLLLDVLEHLENPATVMTEANRVLRQGGELIIKIPFMYPLHDQPRDFIRYTPHGMNQLAGSTGFEVIITEPMGTAIETAALMKNIATVTLVSDWINRRNPLCLLAVFVPIYILFQNSMSFMLDKLGNSTDIMPHHYLFVLRKKRRD